MDYSRTYSKIPITNAPKSAKITPAMHTKWLKALLTALILLSATVALFLYASGYRLSQDSENHVDLTQTGMINAKSVPEGANVYVDGVLRTATDGTVAGVETGIHSLSIVKNGFVTWNKTIEVFPELVTDITAILVSQSPRLEPLTNTGAREPTISPSLSKLAFFPKTVTILESGLYHLWGKH